MLPREEKDEYETEHCSKSGQSREKKSCEKTNYFLKKNCKRGEMVTNKGSKGPQGDKSLPDLGEENSGNRKEGREEHLGTIQGTQGHPGGKFEVHR